MLHVKELMDYFVTYFKNNKDVIPQTTFLIILSVINRIYMISIPSFMIWIVVTNGHSSTKALIICLYVLFGLILESLHGLWSYKNNKSVFLYRYKKIPEISEKVLRINYGLLESGDGQLKIDQAYEAVYNGNNAGVERYLNRCINLIEQSFLLLVCVVICCAVSLKATVALLLLICIGATFQKRTVIWLEKNKSLNDKLNVFQKYLVRQLQKVSNGQEFAFHDIPQWFTDCFKNSMQSKIEWEVKHQNNLAKNNVIVQTIYIISQMVVFFCVYSITNEWGLNISLAVLFVNIMMLLRTLLLEILDTLQDVKTNRVYVRDLTAFEELENEYEGEGKDGFEVETIEFINVSYKPHNAEKAILSNVSFKAKKGDRVALVGSNGAGKSTLIKLICGLYSPTEGIILVNNRNINEYNHIEKEAMFSTVFQDNSIFSFSVAENVSCCVKEMTDYDLVAECLEKAGLNAEMNDISNFMYRIIDCNCEDGIGLSGGQKQKLFIARMLYNLKSCILLDEPTSSLDPISEAELYNTYSKIAKNRISFFVSHRLGSTQFCNLILVIDSGRICEYGCHEELMQRRGYYYEMYNTQKKAYLNDMEVCGEIK